MQLGKVSAQGGKALASLSKFRYLTLRQAGEVSAEFYAALATAQLKVLVIGGDNEVSAVLPTGAIVAISKIATLEDLWILRPKSCVPGELKALAFLEKLKTLRLSYIEVDKETLTTFCTHKNLNLLGVEFSTKLDDSYLEAALTDAVVKGYSFRGCRRLTDKCLKYFAKIAGLKGLTLSQIPQISAVAAEELRSTVKDAWIDFTDYSHQDMEAIGAYGIETLPSNAVSVYLWIETKQDLAALTRLVDSLRSLHIHHYSDITKTPDLDLEKEFKDLSKFKKLEYLAIESACVTDAVAKEIGQLAFLKTLWLGRLSNRFTDAALAEFKGLALLENLTIGEGRTVEKIATFTDKALIAVAELKALKSLIIGKTPIKTTSKGFKALQKIDVLRSIEFIECEYDDDCLKEAAAIPALTSLMLRCKGATKVTDKGLKYLEAMSKAELIGIKGGPKVTQAAKDALAKALPKCKVGIG